MKIRLVVVLLAGVLAISACSTKPPSTSEIATKLSADPAISFIKDSVDATKYQTFVNCAANKFHSNGNPGDLKDYVKGKKLLENIRGKSKTKTTKRPGSTKSKTVTTNADVESIIDDCAHLAVVPGF